MNAYHNYTATNRSLPGFCTVAAGFASSEFTPDPVLEFIVAGDTELGDSTPTIPAGACGCTVTA